MAASSARAPSRAPPSSSHQSPLASRTCWRRCSRSCSSLAESRWSGRPGLGQTEIAIGALREGAIDVYPEYTGTGLLAVLHDSLTDSLASDPRRVFAHVAREFESRYGMRWLPPLGFQNSYAIAVRRNTAAQYHLRTMSDLARESGHLTAGFTADFIGRPDGLAGLARAYGVRPRAVRPLAPAVKYQALATGAVDVIDGYSTDGLLSKYDLVTLVDDNHFFPPYEAAALVGARLARDRPDAIAALTDVERDARRDADARAQPAHRGRRRGREARRDGRLARSRPRHEPVGARAL